MSSKPTVAVIAAGEMGAAVGAKLVAAGCTVYTNLDDRSPATRKRATDAGFKDIPFDQLVVYADWVLSILPPSEALRFAETIVSTFPSVPQERLKNLTFVDCNAVSSETVKAVARVFDHTPVTFLDASIIGGPPTDSYSPTIYVSASLADEAKLDQFANFSQFGLKVSPLKGDGTSLGDASALKMSYAGISKGMIGLYTTMILAAHASSPTISKALLEELLTSQPVILGRLAKSVPGMIPKAYRWIGEMEEIASQVNGPEGDIYFGLSKLYKRIQESLETDGRNHGDVKVLLDFANRAKDLLEKCH